MSVMAASTSRLLGPSPVVEVTCTVMDNGRIDWQVMNFTGQRHSPQELRQLLLMIANRLPVNDSPPQGGTLAADRGFGTSSPLGGPVGPPTDDSHKETSS